MRILFMGTPEYAIAALKMLCEKHDVIGVVTRADKPNKRGNKIQFSPVKEFALEKGIPVFQPENLKDDGIFETLAGLKPELSVVVAYGMIVPDRLIDMPQHGTINIHGSLLPRYRGAAPMQYSVLNGDSEAGVSIMYITSELDAGDVILQKSIPVGADETFGELHDRLSVLGAEALDEAIGLIESGNVNAVPQDGSKATFAPAISKEECVIDWSLPAQQVHNRIRGLSPIPCANTHFADGKLLKVYRSEIVRCTQDAAGVHGLTLSDCSESIGAASAAADCECGTVIGVIRKKGAVIKCGEDAVCITSAKPEGKKELPGFELINGHYLKVGDRLI